VEDKRLLDRALEAEVELLERLAGGEAGLLDARLAAVRVPRGLFGGEQRFGEALVAPLLGAGPLGQLGEGAGGSRCFHGAEEVGELGRLGHAGMRRS